MAKKALPLLDYKVGLIVALLAFVFFWLTTAVETPQMRLWQVFLGLANLVFIVVLRKFDRTLLVLVNLVIIAGWIFQLGHEPFLTAAWVSYRYAFRAGGKHRGVVLVVVLTALFILGLLSISAPADTQTVQLLIVGLGLELGGWLLGLARGNERTLSAQVTREHQKQAAANERIRITGELHDILSHTLSRIGVSAATAVRIKSEQNGELLRTLEGIEKDIRGTLQEVGQVLKNTKESSVVLDSRKLNDISELVTQLQALGFSVESILEVDREANQLVAAATYRIVQECLTNVVKHASRKEVRIELQMKGETEIYFSCENPRDHRKRNNFGLGIQGIGRRVEMLGGTVEIDNFKENRYKIMVKLPRHPQIEE